MTATPRLPPSGVAAVDWAERGMPLLARTMAAHGDVFRDVHVGICLHVEPKTAVLCRWLMHLGARVTITGNIGTTVPDVAAALGDLGVTVVGRREDDHEQHARNLDLVLAARPDVVMDNGGELVERLTAGAPRSPRFVGATEEPTTGGLRIRALEVQPDFPVIVINDSTLKLVVENEFGVGQSIVQGFMNATNTMVPGARATVVGYGPCGKGVADTLRSLGALVSVVERDPYRALDAVMRGHVVAPLETLLPQAELVFLATGARDVLGEEHFGGLRDGVIIAGVGHEAAELDLAALRRAATDVVLLSAPGTDAAARALYRLPDGREVVVLHETRMINLTAAGGNPVQAMDLGLSLQARSLADLLRGRATWRGAAAVPNDTDEDLARDLVALLTAKNRLAVVTEPA